jgi:hypothetical protein
MSTRIKLYLRTLDTDAVCRQAHGTIVAAGAHRVSGRGSLEASRPISCSAAVRDHKLAVLNRSALHHDPGNCRTVGYLKGLLA